MATGLHGRNAFHNGLRRPFDKPPLHVLHVSSIEPFLILDGGVHRAPECLRPFGIGGVVVRMGDDDGFEAAEGFDLRLIRLEAMLENGRWSGG